MLQNVTKFQWNEKKERAVVLVVEDKLTDEQIAAEVEITRQQLARWKKHPEFAAKVESVTQSLANTIHEEVVEITISDVKHRLNRLHDHWERMQQVIEERAQDADMQNVPGGKTGLLVQQIKSVGKGDDFQIVHEYRVDTGLLKELREHEKQAAQELGQWTEKHNHEHAGTINLQLTDAERYARLATLFKRRRTPEGDPEPSTNGEGRT